ncbi:MAG: GNAT family N-acetyltransferase [Actinomycetota bacterium]
MPENEVFERKRDSIIESTRRAIELGGVDSLLINDLTHEDLPDIKWAGGPLHPEAVSQALDRAVDGEVEYLAVRSPNGKPIAIGGIDYAAHEDAGTLWQLSTHSELTSRGIGTRLIREGEKRILRRGLHQAMMGVEDNNPRARALYERLGYKPVGSEKCSWNYQDEDGQVKLYETEETLLRNHLP